MNHQNLTLEEMERIAYISGDTRTATHCAALMDAQGQARTLCDTVERILDVAELHQEDMEPQTQDAIQQARNTVDAMSWELER